jgi:hypothetical protein
MCVLSAQVGSFVRFGIQLFLPTLLAKNLIDAGDRAAAMIEILTGSDGSGWAGTKRPAC